MKAGFIGLGAMGAHMARNIAKTGQLAVVWNRTAKVAEDLARELGVVCAASPADLANQVDVVLICVSADADLLAVIEALLPGLRPGTVVVDHSTVSAYSARRAAERAESRGSAFLDAPVSGGVEGARNGSLSMMVGGSVEELKNIRPVLEAEASRIVHMGDVGAGQATKAVNQIMCAGINQAVTEALAFGEAQGLDMEKVIEVVAGGAAGNWFLDKRGLTMTQGQFVPGFKLSLHHKDLKICLQMAKQLGISLPVAEKTLNEYAKLMELGFGGEDISALYRLKKPSIEQAHRETRTPYERLGGELVLRQLVMRFYEYMNELPEARGIRKMHGADLSRAADKLFKFLSGWLGGPDLFVQEYGHPRLRARHFPFAIGKPERDQWMLCMDKALDDTPMDADLRELMRQALAQTATHMVNQSR